MGVAKKTCLTCTKEYAESSFYLHRNPLINEKFGFCKKCVKEYVKPEEMDTLYDFLRTMDIPYLKDFWKTANDSQNETIGTYFKNLSLKQNRDLRFKDSDDLTAKTTKATLTEVNYDDFDITEEIIRRWGRNLEFEDYVQLEEEFHNLGGYEAETTIQERLFKNMARTQWMANKALEEGDHNKYEKMMKTLSIQMQDANVKPVQVKSASEDGGLKSWGEWVKRIEEKEPCIDEGNMFEPKFVKNYMNRYFMTPMKRVFGLAQDTDVEDLNSEKSPTSGDK